jgi:hypothetical protein
MERPSRGRCRPFGYNPVELSRFAGTGAFGNSISRLARWLRVFADPLAFPEALPPWFHIPKLALQWLPTTRFRLLSLALSGSVRGFPAPPLTTVVLSV